MWIPNGFVPSSINRTREYDEEGRLREVRHDSKGASSSDGAIAESNSLFATDAELFGTITPFMRVNKLRDADRRNYIIQPGGACIYFDPERPPPDPWDNGRVQFTAPSDRETFGHNTQPSASIEHPNVDFRVGRR